MTRYLLALLGLLGSQTIQAQALPGTSPSGNLPAPPDTTARLPLPGPDTLRVLGPRLPATVQEHLRLAAGVQVTPVSGAPGTLEVVRIRGAASLSSEAQPLYVVDGIFMSLPTFTRQSGPQSSRYVQPLGSNPLLSLPPEDVASIEVLKGAFETAQYGSLGQHGVVRITTKRGNQGPLRVHYSGYGGVQQARYRYDLLDATQYATLANEVADAYPFPRPYTDAQLASLGRGTNWQKEITRVAAVQEQHISLGGGIARTRYYIGADYLTQAGVVQHSYLRRHGLRANVDQQVGQRLYLSAGVNLNQVSQRTPLEGLMTSAVYSNPVQLVRDANGEYAFDPRAITNYNAVQNAAENHTTAQNRRLQARLSLRYIILPGLTLHVQGAWEYDSLTSNLQWQSRLGYGPDARSTVGNDNQLGTHRQQFVNPALRFARVFGRHALTANLDAFSHRYHWTQQYSQESKWIGSTELSRSWGTNMISWLTKYYQLTGSYTYDRRYELRGTLRAENNSFFRPDEAWKWLPGGQATWHLTEESWWQSAVISRLDAQVGWGRTVDGDYYASETPYLDGLYPFSAVLQGYPQRRMRATQQDATVRLGLWQNTLLLTAAAYQRTNRFSYESYTWSTYPGNRLSPIDVDIRNRGLELTAAGTWRRARWQGVSTLAASTNRNVFRRDNDDPFYFSTYNTIQPGQPLSTFYGYRYEGVTTTGEPLFNGQNANGTRNPDDQEPLGSGLPRYLLSFNQQLTHGRLGAQVQLDGMFGYQMLNTALTTLDAPDGRSNSTTRVLDRWTPTQPNATVPRAGLHSLPAVSTYTLQSGNHVRLTTVQLSYRVWQQGPRNLELWGAGYNLLVLTRYRGFDPNVSAAGSDGKHAGLDTNYYPTARTVALGIRATL